MLIRHLTPIALAALTLVAPSQAANESSAGATGAAYSIVISETQTLEPAGYTYDPEGARSAGYQTVAISEDGTMVPDDSITNGNVGSDGDATLEQPDAIPPADPVPSGAVTMEENSPDQVIEVVANPPVDNVTLAFNVRAALWAEQDPTAPQVRVGARDGVVQLSGRSSETVKARAEGIARDVPGVVDVRDYIQVSR